MKRGLTRWARSGKCKKMQDEDISQIIKVYEACLPGTWTMEEWKWKYLKLHSEAFVERDPDTKKITASVASTPVKVRINDKLCAFAAIVDVSTLKEYRNRGIASKLMKATIESAEAKRYDGLLLYCKPTHSAWKIYHGLGFRTLQHVNIIVKANGFVDATKNSPFPVNIAMPFLSIYSSLLFRVIRKNVWKSLNTQKLDLGDKKALASYLRYLNQMLRRSRMSQHYTESCWDTITRKAPQSAGVGVGFVERRGHFVYGGTSSCFRAKQVGRSFKVSIIGDLFVSFGDLAKDAGRSRAGITLTACGRDDKLIQRVLHDSGFIKVENLVLLMLPLFKNYLIPHEKPFYIWKQAALGIP